MAHDFLESAQDGVASVQRCPGREPVAAGTDLYAALDLGTNSCRMLIAAPDGGRFRVVDAFARRFQVQEKMTAQIAHCIQEVLAPRGVAVVVEAAHQCMTTRGVHKTGVSMVTSQMLGDFREDARTRAEFMKIIQYPRYQRS